MQIGRFISSTMTVLLVLIQWVFFKYMADRYLQVQNSYRTTRQLSQMEKDAVWLGVESQVMYDELK